MLFALRRTSIHIEFAERKEKVVQITGWVCLHPRLWTRFFFHLSHSLRWLCFHSPWKEAILYVLDRSGSKSFYDPIFEKQFVDVNQHANISLRDFIEVLAENFTRYQRHVDGEYQIVPREKQKRFLEHIISGEECFHFSEVGSGKTKGMNLCHSLIAWLVVETTLTCRWFAVIMPLLCQIFLSNNKDAHKHLARGGKLKDTLVILVPEHLLPDARTQVFRHCLNLNFRQEYRIYDDILSLLHKDVNFGTSLNPQHRSRTMKQIFVTSFNQFKKALTYDKICKKIRPHREHILVVADEVDDFLGTSEFSLLLLLHFRWLTYSSLVAQSNFRTG